MLVPHFSQVWYLLTPPTGVLTFGTLGDNFPGNFNAASGMTHVRTYVRAHTHTYTVRGGNADRVQLRLHYQ